jgi:hypothetical protein
MVLNAEITNAQVMRLQHLGHLSFSKSNDDHHETTITSSNGSQLHRFIPKGAAADRSMCAELQTTSLTRGQHHDLIGIFEK